MIEAKPRAEIYDRERRAYNDATTWLAETLDGPMLTPFEYTFDGRELYADDGGALEPIFEEAIADARELARKNPSLSFELRRRCIEMDEYGDMLKMARGELPNTMVTVSDFPPELMSATKDVGGYNTSRKQTMLRVITRLPNGRLRMQSQSLDGSNRQALEAIYKYFGELPEPGELLGQRIHAEIGEVEQELLADVLTSTYDSSLEAQTGQRRRAGRQLPDNPGVETYQFVCSQKDLLRHLTNKMLGDQLDRATMFSVAATMAGRYEALASSAATSLFQEGFIPASPEAIEHALQAEMNRVVAAAIAEGRVFSGCGASISLDAESQLSASGFGNKAKEEPSWHGGRIKNGKCVNCKKETKVGVKDWCKNCISGHCGTK